MNAAEVIASKIEEAIDLKLRNALKVRTTTLPAMFSGTDDQGKGWVLLPGAPSPTPVRRSSVEASEGDTVSVTIANGRAVIDSNISNPSVGVTTVQRVEQKADDAGKVAQRASNYAQDAATAMTAARESARQALATANGISAIAEEAKESAADAAQSASDAYLSSQHAAYGLSEVEKIVDTVNWVAAHGTYVKTEDTTLVDGKIYYTRSESYEATDDEYIDPEKTYYRMVDVYTKTTDAMVVPGKTYYIKVGDDYIQVENPEDAALENYYELSHEYVEADLPEYTYTLTSDTSVVESKTYFELEGGEYVLVTPAGDEDPSEEGWYERDMTPATGLYEIVYTYTIVFEPDESMLSEYYEMILSDTVQNYLMKHIVMNDDGLTVFADDSFYRLVVSNDGIRMLDSLGIETAFYGSSATVGPVTDFHITTTRYRMEFHQGDTLVSYIDNNQMTIPHVAVKREMQVGKWAWVNRDSGNMSLVWIGDE